MGANGKKTKNQHYLASFRDGGQQKDRKIAKKKAEKSTFKPLSTIFVPCLKIQVENVIEALN